MSTTLTTNGDGVNVLPITTDKRGLAARYRVGIRTVEAGRVMESSSVAAYSAEAKPGRVSVDWPSANSLTRAWRRVIEKAGVPYQRNAFRNSYITYRLILTEDIAKVAEVPARGSSKITTGRVPQSRELSPRNGSRSENSYSTPHQQENSAHNSFAKAYNERWTNHFPPKNYEHDTNNQWRRRECFADNDRQTRFGGALHGGHSYG